MAKQYTPEQIAQTYVVLVTNEWNVKRTARDTGVPESTVRSWASGWKENPPDIDVDFAVDEAVGDFLAEAEVVRFEAIKAIRNKIPDAKVGELTTLVGVLTDKIDRAKGLALGRVEHVHTLPSPDELRAALQGAMQGALAAASQREHEIIDAEVVELEQAQKALPPVR